MRKFVLILALALPVVVKAQKADTLQRLTPYQLESLQKSSKMLRDGSNAMAGGVIVGLLGVGAGAYIATQEPKIVGRTVKSYRTTGGIVMLGGAALGITLNIIGANQIANAGGWLKNLWRTSKPQSQIDYESSRKRRKR